MAGDLRIEPDNRVENGTGSGDKAIAQLADAQHRLVARAQLMELGLSRSNIGYRVSAGRLHLVLPGVYAVGARRLRAEGRLMAVVLWAGPGAFISHRSAATLQGLMAARGTIRRDSRPGIAVHHRHFPADEVTRHDGIPVTTVARTLLDVAASEGRDSFVRALRQAEYLRLADATSLPTLIARYPKARGTAVAAAALGERRVSGHTESELEDRFLEFLAAWALPPPRANAWIEVRGERFRVDCLWPEEMVVVELDGRPAHDGDDRFESDRRRDLALMSVGYTVARVTWRRLHDDPDGLAHDMRALLDARARRASAA